MGNMPTKKLFDGKYYKFHSSHLKREVARREADKLRKKGYRVRTVKEQGLNIVYKRDTNMTKEENSKNKDRRHKYVPAKNKGD